jgi:hypothetical protein
VTRTHRTLATLALALVLVLGIVATGCGVPLDSEPQVITRTTVARPDATEAPTTSPTPGAAEVSVYFLRGDRLEEQRFPVAGEPTLPEALRFALADPAEVVDPDTDPSSTETADPLRTAVPPGTELRAVQVRDGVAAIDLTDQINDINGQSQKQAFAQLVFTALAFSQEVDHVRFSVDGKAIDAPTDQGNLTLVGESDYDPPLNPR